MISPTLEEHDGGVNLRSADWALVISLLLLLLYWFAGSALPWMASPTVLVYQWLLEFSLMSGYLGAAVISFFGNATVLFPFPYVGVPYILGGVRDPVTMQFVFDPMAIGLAAGAGAVTGEMTGYLLGYLGGEVSPKSSAAVRSLMSSHPRLIPAVLFLLAATPIPDDMVVVPLGLAKYDWRRVLVPQLLGKCLFLTGVAWAGRISLGWVDSILCSLDPTNPVSRAVEVVAIALIVVVIYFGVRSGGQTLSFTSRTE
ncbi:MAG: hypothetical protein HXY34_03480 [Candidatus Thorarchaeota archaeon]|nr:hypothetical protein [Candidatus Thorarchaeota archaeon]